MNLNQYTVKSQEAIQKAQQIALDFGNQSIEPQHLLEGIFQVDENISAFLMKKAEADLNLIRQRNRESLESLPKVEGGFISRKVPAKSFWKRLTSLKEWTMSM